MIAEVPEASWRARLEEARRAWPDLTLDEATFARFVEQKLADDAAPPDRARAFEQLRIADLYLARACASRDPAAIARFEEKCFAEIGMACARFPRLPVTQDDIVQRMRDKLFVTDPPGISAYGGRGELRGWLRAAVVHLLLNVASRESREQPTEETFFDAIIGADASAEAEYSKLTCRAEFEQAFAAALASLSNRDKSLLRYAYSDGLSVDGISAIFRVHRATAARWVAAAREKLVEETLAELVARLDISATEAQSIVRAALSGIGTTLLRRLAST